MQALVLILKTCGPYHGTRLPAAMDAWASRFPQRVIATDAPVVGVKGVEERDVVVTPDLEMKQVTNETKPDNAVGGGKGAPVWLVKTGEIAPRDKPYQNPWRSERSYSDGVRWESYKAEDMVEEYTTMPALTERVANALKLAYDRYHPSVDWYVIADDDAFLRVKPFQTYLSSLDPSQPLAVGRPVKKESLLTPWSLSLHPPFHHCAGNGWALSRSAVTALRPVLDECLETPHLVLPFYYDEIQIGRCLQVLLGIECVEPRSPAHDWFEAPLMANGSIFFDKKDQGDQEGKVSFPPIKYHPVLPHQQSVLRGAFNKELDKAWVRRFKQQSRLKAQKEGTGHAEDL